MAPGRAATRFLDTVTVNGGAGNDRIVLTGVDAAVIDLGTGDDLLQHQHPGRCRVQRLRHHHRCRAGHHPACRRRRRRIHHSPRERGSRLHRREFWRPLRAPQRSGGAFAATSWVNTTNFTGLTSSTQDMFDNGHLRLVQSGADMLLQADRDGTGTASGFVTIAGCRARTRVVSPPSTSMA